ncbi:hypothetical protein HYPSUDRAFT_955673 [Hypholoma sublateritium FD-334 SS-4]|uniref:Nephrocystin 3-like N-terminal domain-containing protein n=1 Tax=Hypholoma sublateritium (strain FD-334 SS-4) TaxID=945553 RepID=A0A0D2NHU6_HYPSF|nr:hypothetical protein HYPSUDRAFT_955673 [Hypholoma sublateritium FD-334 SS-4]
MTLNNVVKPNDLHGNDGSSASTKSSFISVQNLEHSLFSKSNVVVTGGSFIANMRSETECLFGWNTLVGKTSMDAFHNSAARCHLPRCSNRPHEEVLKQIIEPIKAQTISTRITWVHGAVGTSEMAQYVADSCVTSDIRPSTFFFGEVTEKCFSSFIPTIAYQLCLRFPDSRKLVAQAIDDDPAILSRSPLDQLDALIISPFTTLRHLWNSDNPNPRLVVIIDAIHRCSAAHQRLLIQAISSAAEHFAFPATFVIFSKPTTHIKLAFMEYANTIPVVDIKIQRGGPFKPLVRNLASLCRSVFYSVVSLPLSCEILL